MRIINFLILVMLLVLLTSCVPMQEDATNSPSSFAMPQNQLSPEESEALLEEVGKNWLYGNGLGDMAITAGTVALFPPYILWVAGNSALSLSGQKPLSLADALPEEDGQVLKGIYDEVSSVPGRMSANLAGEEFRDRKIAQKKLQKYITSTKNE